LDANFFAGISTRACKVNDNALHDERNCPEKKIPFSLLSTFRRCTPPQNFSATPANTSERMAAPEIPDTLKWQIAARIASSFPVMYDMAFRPSLGEEYDLLEQDIWIHLGTEAAHVARSFSLPAGNSEEIASTLVTMFSVFFGPETKHEQVKFEGDRAVVMIKRCPFLTRDMEMRRDAVHLFSKCLAFAITTTEALNPEYTLRFVRSMCMGDRNCEMKIVRKETLKEEKKTH
jgi:hypothetical protein